MRVYQIDPARDARWARLVRIHPNASVFHTASWLSALRHTYGYEAVAFTTSPPTGDLKNCLVFCRVKSWLTGNRLVSLPFSDHCDPLCDSAQDREFLLRYLQSALEHQNWKYLELRPVHTDFGDNIGLIRGPRYFLHRLSLAFDENELFRRLHKDSVQRRIRRAERAGLIEKTGRSEALARDFYKLFIITRRRHRLPPIPYKWFENLIAAFNTAVEIRLAYKDGTAIAGIVTLRFRDVLYYKYGCSDVRFKQYGAIPWLFWRAILSGKSSGAIQFDMGRTEETNYGLLAFKNRWVAEPEHLQYWAFPRTSSLKSADNWKFRLAQRVFSKMPKSLLATTGKLLYRHIG